MIRKNFARRTLHDMRVASELARARPAYAAGFRAAIATVVPMLVGGWLTPGAGAWLSLAGLNGAIIDRGGPYRMRAAIMSMLAIASAVAALVGTLASGHFALSIVVAFVIALLCGLARAWTDVGPGFGVTVLVTFAIALAVPSPTVGGAFLRALYIIVGGLWAMLLAIVLWPIRPYRPVRLRVAECFRFIADYIDDAAAALARGERHDPWRFKSQRVAVRTAIENARTALALSRRSRSGESSRGERLLVLHEVADQLVAHLVALLEVSETLATPNAIPQLRALAETLNAAGRDFRALADAIESEHDVPRIVVSWSGDDVRRAANDTGGACDPQLVEILDRMSEYTATGTAITASLNSGAPVAQHEESIDVAELPARPVLFSIAAILHADSMVLHHALRVAFVTAAAVAIAGLLHLRHGYWVTLTAVVILQPYVSATRQKALQRVIGTILGGIAAALFVMVFHSMTAILVLIALFTMLCVTLLPLNYGAYAVFGTPAFVLIAEASEGDWHLAGLRIANTLIGSMLALIGAAVLWPGDEWKRFPDTLGAALRANDDYLRSALALLESNAPSDIGVLRAPRRRIAQAAASAEDALQRLISEHRGSPQVLEPVMALVVYVRRLAAATAALALAGYVHDEPPRDALAPFGRAAHDILNDLIGAIEEGRAPAPYPVVGAVPLPDAERAPVLHRRLVRIARQIKLVHDAATRWLVAGAETRVLARTGEFPAREASSATEK